MGLFAVLCEYHEDVAEGFVEGLELFGRCGILPISQVTDRRRLDMGIDCERKLRSPGAKMLEICGACSLHVAEDPRDCPMVGVAECSEDELGEANAQLADARAALCRRAQCDEATDCRELAPPAERLSKWDCPTIRALGNPVALQQACMIFKCPQGLKDLYA